MIKKRTRKIHKTKSNAFALIEDLVFISIGIAIAIILSKTGLFDSIVSIFDGYYILAIFITGIFFTSAFTLAPASVAFVHIAQTVPILDVVIWGALGAMFGDLILFFFIKDRFARDLLNAIHPRVLKRFMKSLHFGFMKWFSPILGALIIASPLPDEFGITLLGMSKVRLVVLLPIAFIMNLFGIYILITFSQFL